MYGSERMTSVSSSRFRETSPGDCKLNTPSSFVVHSPRRWSIHANQEQNDLFNLFLEVENNGFPFSRRLDFEKVAS